MRPASLVASLSHATAFGVGAATAAGQLARGATLREFSAWCLVLTTGLHAAYLLTYAASATAGRGARAVLRPLAYANAAAQLFLVLPVAIPLLVRSSAPSVRALVLYVVCMHVVVPLTTLFFLTRAYTALVAPVGAALGVSAAWILTTELAGPPYPYARLDADPASLRALLFAGATLLQMLAAALLVLGLRRLAARRV